MRVCRLFFRFSSRYINRFRYSGIPLGTAGALRLAKNLPYLELLTGLNLR